MRLGGERGTGGGGGESRNKSRETEKRKPQIRSFPHPTRQRAKFLSISDN